MSSSSRINRKNKKRLDRMFQKYVKPGLSYENLMNPPIVDFFENILPADGWESSVLLSRTDYEYRHTPVKIRNILRKVNILNHSLNIVFFANQLIRTKSSNEYERKINWALFYILWPELGKIKLYRQSIAAEELDFGHCEAGARLFAIRKIFKIESIEQEIANRIKFAFAPPTDKDTNKFTKNFELWRIYHGPSVMLHALNLRARFLELKDFPELQEEYLHILTDNQIRLLYF